MKNSFLTKVRRKLKFIKDVSWGNMTLFFSPFCKKTFAQCGEDVIVRHIFDALGIINPTYIDIGAHHPFKHSNTALFHLLGSRGVNIEPDPDLYARFPASRPSDKNLNIGIASEPGELNFYTMKDRTLNTFSEEKATDCQENQGIPIASVRQIKVIPLEQVLKEHANGQFWDFMSLDVEGFELDILKSHNWEASCPKVICCETLTFSNSGKGEKEQQTIDFLVDKGYMVYADTHVNTIFVQRSLWQG